MNFYRISRAALFSVLAAWVTACQVNPPLSLPTQPSGRSAGGDTVKMLQPNANLLLQDIPPLPESVLNRAQKYLDFRGYGFVAWHPTQPWMLVAHRRTSVPQLFLVKGPGAEPEQVTFTNDAISDASFEPKNGSYIVYSQSTGGNEVYQLYRLSPGQAPVRLTNPDERNSLQGWNWAGNALLFTSVPLDRTAQQGRRTSIETKLQWMDPLKPESRRTIATLSGGGWFGAQFTPDDQEILITNYRSAEESEIWLVDPQSGQPRRLLPESPAIGRASHVFSGFTADGKGFYFFSNRNSEFNNLYVFDRGSGRISKVGSDAQHEISSATSSRDGQRMILNWNIDGASRLELSDLQSGKRIAMPDFPVSTISQVSFHPKLRQVAFSVNNASGPSDVFVFDEATAKHSRWTRAIAPAGAENITFRPFETIRWKSFDGLQISGLIVRPPPSFQGRRPVLIDIHGGPEAQSRPAFQGRWNYLINELGVAIIEPNVRGSRGYGKTFLSLDNGYKREDAVKDIGALLDWIAQQPDLDPQRVMVMGASYGGYMSLASAIHFSDRLAGAIDIVGISHFVTFLETTESYRRDLRRVEYGDERIPEMRAFLNKISPLTNADKIKIPLFVIQGKNDPRVPYTEAEQIVAKARSNGRTVWYLRADNEGHGFVRKENADFQFAAITAFVENFLLKNDNSK